MHSVTADTGSYRDPSNRVYCHSGRILRGVDEPTTTTLAALLKEEFFQKLVQQNAVVRTWRAPGDDARREILAAGWNDVFEHQPIPVISYPYEWSFSMLKDAALLQLQVLEQALHAGWTLKDATPYNVQWQNGQPLLIDIGSFEKRERGAPWTAYHQFCCTFLIPLLLAAHLDLDVRSMLRSSLEGIPPADAAKIFGVSRWFRRGVLSHVILPAAVEKRATRASQRPSTSSSFRHSDAMVLGLVQGLSRLVRKLSPRSSRSQWNRYTSSHSYADMDMNEKVEFVSRHLKHPRDCIWDLGCNTGKFSKIASATSNIVVSIDADIACIEDLYRQEGSRAGTNILPLAINLANPSPNQGWAGEERRSLDRRSKPSLIMCLALVHHVRVSASVPLPMFFRWLASHRADLIIEFVDPADEMFQQLLEGKTIRYEDYSRAAFVESAEKYFRIDDSRLLKNGLREIFFMRHLTE